MIEISEEELAKLRSWKEAIVNATVVDWVYTEDIEDNPRKAVNSLLAWQSEIALNPLVSKEARDLHTRIQDAEFSRDVARFSADVRLKHVKAVAKQLQKLIEIVESYDSSPNDRLALQEAQATLDGIRHLL